MDLMAGGGVDRRETDMSCPQLQYSEVKSYLVKQYEIIFL